jgi:peroxiredoxin
MILRPIILTILILFSAMLCLQPAQAAEIGLDIGKLAPSFALKDLAGKTIRPLERRDKITLLNFWSTLCAPCVSEMASLNRLHASLGGPAFEVVAVAIDSSEKPVRELALQKKIAFTILLDTEKEIFFDLYAGPALPMSYLIDRNGIIVETFSGPREWDSPDMKNAILKILEKR